MEKDVYQQQKYFKRCPHNQLSQSHEFAYKYGVVSAAVYQQLSEWIDTTTLRYEGDGWVNPKEIDWVTEIPYIPLGELMAALEQLIAVGKVYKQSLIIETEEPDDFFSINRGPPPYEAKV